MAPVAMMPQRSVGRGDEDICIVSFLCLVSMGEDLRCSVKSVSSKDTTLEEWRWSQHFGYLYTEYAKHVSSKHIYFIMIFSLPFIHILSQAVPPHQSYETIVMPHPPHQQSKLHVTALLPSVPHISTHSAFTS